MTAHAPLRAPALLALLALVAAALASLTTPATVYACSCAAPVDAQAALSGSTAVFRGTVVRLQPGSITDRQVKVDLDVSEQWKGDPGTSVTLTTASNEAACGYSFVKGTEYLVYADGKADDLETNLCSRTAPVADAGDDLAALGPGAKPVTASGAGGQPADGSGSDFPTGHAIAAAAGCIALLALGGALIVRRMDNRPD
jgi:hypothetical protein